MDRAPGDGECLPVQHESVTLERHIQRWLSELANHGRSPLTIRQYTYNLGYFERWLKAYGIEWRSVTRADVEQWLSNMRGQGLSLKTIHSRLSTARDFYKFLTATDVIPKDPFMYIKTIRIPRKLPAVLNLKEIDRLAKACKNWKERAIIETLYSTGMRRAGLQGIKLGDLDLEAGTVKIVAKGGREMYCLLNRRAIYAIRKWLKERATYPVLKRRPTEQLFIGYSGSMCSTHIGVTVKRIAIRAGINKRCTTHSLRHAMATALVDQGVELIYVRDILGHSDVSTTQIYAHTSTARIKQAWGRLPR